MGYNTADHGHANRAVLWDVDGTLLDSAAYHWQAWHDTLALEGFPLTWEQFASSFGQRNDAVLRAYFGADFPLSEVDRIADAKENRYRELMREGGVTLLPGVGHWLRQLHAEGWRQAVASSAPRLNVITILEALDIGRYFDAIVSAEDVQRGKPDPQVFLTAAAKVGVSPEHCIVVEDAPAGIEGARRAGMRTIGVLSTQVQLDADVVVGTLADLPADAFSGLLRSTTA
jgi:beta-phosphoglucomutase